MSERERESSLFRVLLRHHRQRRGMSQLDLSIAAEVSARWEVSFSGTGDVFLTKPGPLVETLRGAVAEATGRMPALTTNGGTSDARFIQAYCPVIEFGLTNALAHHVDERVAVADLLALTMIYERFIERYFAVKV